MQRLIDHQTRFNSFLVPGVNMASRMETLSESMQITVSSSTYELIKEDFQLSLRGEFEVKGFGEQTLYFLERELPTFR